MSRSRSARTRSPNRRVKTPGPNAWRVCCPPHTASFYVDEPTEPRGADRSGPRGIVEHRCAELLHRCEGREERIFSAESAGRRIAQYPAPAVLLPYRRHRGRLLSDRQHDALTARDNSLDYKIAGIDVPQIQGCPS